MSNATHKSTAARPPRERSSSPPVRPRVLVVDDSPLIRSLVRASLVHAGFTVLEAEGGWQAFELLATVPVAAVVSDVVMADGGGLELLRRIRAHYPEKAVVMMSATEDFPDDAPAAPFFRKAAGLCVGLVAALQRELNVSARSG